MSRKRNASPGPGSSSAKKRSSSDVASNSEEESSGANAQAYGADGDLPIGEWSGRGGGTGLLTCSTSDLARKGSKKVIMVVFKTNVLQLQDTAYFPFSTSLFFSFTFDFDDTLACSKSGQKWKRPADDWRWFDHSVPAKLQREVQGGAKIIVVSNQGGVNMRAYNADTERVFVARCSQVMQELLRLGVPTQAFAATKDDHRRKPGTGMWDEFVGLFNGGVQPDLDQCLFVGDAAGRIAGWAPGKKKDWSCSDRKLANNLGVSFMTPDEYFLGLPKAPFRWDANGPVVDPSAVSVASFFSVTSKSSSVASTTTTTPPAHTQSTETTASTTTSTTTTSSTSLAPARAPDDERRFVLAATADGFDPVTLADASPADFGPLCEGGVAAVEALPPDGKPELILFVGFPGAGKSTFARKHFVSRGYVHVNQDTLKTRPKCLKLCRETLAAGNSAVVDNTNPGAAVRAEYIALAKKLGARVRCMWFQCPMVLAKHLNHYRRQLNPDQKKVPGIAYNMFKKHFQPPAVSEGLDSVLQIQFVPDFASDHERSVFKQRA